jgi:hypothetical protein
VKVEFELWHLITLTLTLAALFTGLGKLVLAQFERRIDDRLDSLLEESRTWQTVKNDVRAVENDVLKLRLEMAERFVRRDDYIRGQTVIEAKLDAIAKDLSAVQIQGAKRETT